MEELRACDCGAVDRLRVGAIEVDHSGYYLSSVNCFACRCAGPVVEVKGEEEAIAAAIAGWNHRPAEDALRALLRRAKTMIEDGSDHLAAYVVEELLDAIDAALDSSHE